MTYLEVYFLALIICLLFLFEPITTFENSYPGLQQKSPFHMFGCEAMHAKCGDCNMHYLLGKDIVVTNPVKISVVTTPS